MTHDERTELIHRPFFITYFGTSYPWGGVAVADTFYSDMAGMNWAERAVPSGERRSHLPLGPYGSCVTDSVTKFGIDETDLEIYESMKRRKRTTKEKAVA